MLPWVCLTVCSESSFLILGHLLCHLPHLDLQIFYRSHGHLHKLVQGIFQFCSVIWWWLLVLLLLLVLVFLILIWGSTRRGTCILPPRLIILLISSPGVVVLVPLPWLILHIVQFPLVWLTKACMMITRANFTPIYMLLRK